MALTFTPEAELGRPCPDFRLESVGGGTFGLNDFAKSKVLVVMFICNHCPYVKAIEKRILNLAHSYKSDDVSFVAICSNDPTEHPEDSFESLAKTWREKKYGFAYLFDETQQVARVFDAVCTPDFFVYDKNRRLAYRGRLDDFWKDETKVKKAELKDAIDRLVTGKEVNNEQFPSMGCSIKWKDE